MEFFMRTCFTLLSTFLTLLALSVSVSALAQNTKNNVGNDVLQDTELFPFVISYDGPKNATSMAHLLDGPAGKDGFIRVENGHFVNDKGRIRFHATNLTGPANFPTHEQADKLADRLARLGINCVRMHYFDSSYGTFMFDALPGIIDINDKTQKILNAEQRDRQDYLIAALKKRGIYTNMNLHVARYWDERDGFVKGGPWANKGTDNFEPRMIEEQKIYARELLTHKNPYTGLRYTEEPAIAMIEINNENALWMNYRNGGMDNLPKVYADEFQRQWNVWLQKKYGTTEELKNAWKCEKIQLHDEQITDKSFSPKNWKLLQLRANTTTVTSENGVLTVKVTENGELYPKIHRRVSVKKDEVYTLSFRIRRLDGNGAAELGLAVADEVDGWRSLGLLTRFKVGKEWKKVTYPIYASDNSESATIQITRFAVGSYEIADLSFQSGADGYQITGTLEDKTIPILKSKDVAPRILMSDFAQFLNDTEYAYWTGIYHYVRDELKAPQPISGTQLNYSPSYVQAALDYVDHHAYWLHPTVHKDWEIGNSAMVNSSYNCVTGMASQRVAGKPFTVSEYNHPFPNYFGAEGQPMLRAYGAFQDWDGVFEYTYNHNPDFEPQKNTYFFSMICRTDVLAHIPACAAMFLRGDVQTAKECVTANIPTELERERIARRAGVSVSISTLGVDGRMPLVHRTEVALHADRAEATGIENAEESLNALKNYYVSDTGELIWDNRTPGKGVFLVTSKNTKLFTGFPEGKTFDLADGVALSVGKTRLGWATVSLTSRNANGFGQNGASNILLTATGYCENAGQVAEKRAGNKIHLSTWGEGPVVAEGISGTVTLPTSAENVRVYALNPHGDRVQELTVTATEDGKSTFQIGPEYQTVWYEIDVIK